MAKKTQTVKVKVGAGLVKDKEIINKINACAGGKLKINLDANRAYKLNEAILLAQWGKKHQVKLFEEPIMGNLRELREFKKATGVEVMLDESVRNLQDLDSAIKAECFDVLNIKLTRLGGLSLAKEYVQRCQKARLQIYLGCSEELEIGTRAIFTLASDISGLKTIEGFGKERIDETKEFSYSSGNGNREVFLAREFWGVWKTRAENFLQLSL